MNVPARVVSTGEVMESVLLKGDLARLEPHERVNYYNAVCQSIGLNPLTRPLEYIMLNGKLQLYAKRDCADQLRRLRKVSIEIITQGLGEGIYTVHVRATDGDGRTDEDLGAVPLSNEAKGEYRANQILKAITKAKRRVTLSICGLGFLDETEVEDIPAAAKRPLPPLKKDMNDEIPDFDRSPAVEATAGPAHPAAEAGAAVTASDPHPAAPAKKTHEQVSKELLEAMTRKAAEMGPECFDAFYKAQSKESQEHIRTLKAQLLAEFPNLAALGLNAIPKQKGERRGA